MMSVGILLRLVGSPINRYVAKSAFSTTGAVNAKVAVVLSGCGVYDGSEVHEASACMVHLSRSGADVSVFAPNSEQMHVIDHTKGAPAEGEKRNVLVESARIARGNITTLSDLKVTDYDAVVFPGGFGAAKNLSSFAVDGTAMSVNTDVSRVLKDFHSAKKPIGLCCISPVLAAKVLGNVTLTVGSDQEEGGRWPYAGTAGAIQEMGAKHVKCSVTEAVTDEANKIVTSPAFMCAAKFHEIYDGIGEMIQQVLKLT